jgi:hypothetical protein
LIINVRVVLSVGIRRKLDIELLLSWAYRDELPKQELAASAWDSIDHYCQNGGQSIDEDPWQAHLRSQRYAFIGKPHNDALYLDWFVNTLADQTIGWPSAKRSLLHHLEPYLTPATESAIRKIRVQPAGLVRAHARMGTRPMWDLYYRFDPVLLKNKKPLVQYVDRHGRITDCHSGQRDYLRGGRCPLMLAISSRSGECGRLGDPLLTIVGARFEYLAWHTALRELVERVKASGGLADHEPIAPRAEQLPWINGVEEKPRVLEKIPTCDDHLTKTKRRA